MKKLHLLSIIGILGVFFAPVTSFAQNINTDTTSTTLGSTQFGVVLSNTELQTIMQSSVALNCAGPVENRVCTPVGNGTSTAFVRVDQLPGSFTDRPVRPISSNPNFACGPVASSTDCSDLNVPGNLSGGLIFLTSPDVGVNGVGVTGPNQLIGDINININLGDGGATAGMPDGFIRFTLDPAVAGGSSATIDQFIDHSINLGGGSLMVFQQREATIGAGNLIPDLAMSDPENNPLTLLTFSTTNPNHTLALPALDIGLVSRTIINQGAADGFGALNLDATFNFPASQANGGLGPGGFPAQGTFVTPGLNTGINAVGFGPEFNGFAFP